MQERILITGGSGLLALNWAATFRERYAVILGLNKRRISLAGVSTVNIDLESVDGLVRALEAMRPQTVIHTAGLTNVDKCEAEPLLARHVNADLAANVAQACAKLGLRLVHISTDHLFPGDVSLVDEAHPVAAVNTYGRTKAEAELRVLEAHPAALVIRTNFYGWGTAYRHSFSDAIIASLRAGRPMTLFQDVFYTPILAEGAAKSTHELIDQGASGIYHVTGDERISKYEFGLAISREFNLDPGLIEPGHIGDNITLVRRPRDMSLSNQKTCRLLGRKLGGVGEHIARLRTQEQNGLSREMHAVETI